MSLLLKVTFCLVKVGNSTAPPIPRRSWRRPLGWSWTRWCSPTTTGCTGRSGSTTPPANSASGSGSAPSSRSTCPPRRPANPTRPGRTCWCSPGSRRATTDCARVISHAQIAGGEKGRPVYNIEEVVDELAGHVVVLTGCRKGPVRRALAERGPAAARAELERLVDWFGHQHVAVELINHRQPLDDAANDLLDGLARDLRLPTVVSNNVHYARPDDVVGPL
jgi:hypothetical protein